MKALKLGIIGPGIFFHKRHFPVLTKGNSFFSVEAVCTSCRGKFDHLKGFFPGAKWYADADALLKKDLDCVSVCAPIPAHDEVAQKVLSAGRHLLIEKPLTHSASTAQALVKLAEKKRLKLMVAESYCYLGIVERLKEVLREKTLGELLHVRLQMINRLDEKSPYYSTPWRISPKGYPGILWDGGIHLVSFLREVFGNFHVQHRVLKSINPLLGRFDTAFFHLRFKNNVPAAVCISYSLPTAEDHFLTLYFKNGVVKSTLSAVEIDCGERQKQSFLEETDVYEMIYREFHDYIAEGTEPRYTAREACRDLKVLTEMIC